MNADVPWDAAFDSIAYLDHNYRALQAEDAEILHIIRDHFGDHFRKQGVGPVSGIDVGEIAHDSYDNMFVVSTRSPGSGTLVRARYGS